MSKRKPTEQARQAAELAADREEVQRGYATLRDALAKTDARADAMLERLKKRVPKRAHLRLVSR